MEKGISGIYRIINPKGRIYVGQTICLLTRKSDYKRLKCKKQTRLYNSILKYGFNNHIFEILEVCNIEDLSLRERYWQEYYEVIDKYKGLNCVLVNTKFKPSKYSTETKNKMRAAKKGMYFGTDNPFYGKKHSKEAIEKIKEANRIYKEKFGVYNKGIPMKESQKILLGENSPTSKLCIHLETGIFYTSIKDISKTYNLNYNHMKFKLKQKNDYKSIRVIV
jgi:group I intron endonuclease